jgi:peptidoglycan L-alanyl-D-glutamate endopeptidase CwlK
MPSFGTSSSEKLDTCDDKLQALCELVIEHYDFTVLEGHRSGERQNELFRQGKSKLKAGQSRHNSLPSKAVDICPYPIDWDDHRRFYFLAGLIKQAAHDCGVRVRLGADWDGDGLFSDQTFHDLPHVELVDD